LGPKADSTSYSNAAKAQTGLEWLFPLIGVPILLIGILLFAKSAKDLWILQDILPAFLAFSLLLGLSLILGQSKSVVPNAAIALGLLAIVPSLKYGFVYSDADAVGHYSAAVQIAQTGSVAGATYRASTVQYYAATPLLHILLAMAGLVGGLRIEATIVCTLFLEHFAILVMVAESARRMLPRIERRLIVFLTIMTLPVLVDITGTTYGLLPVAMLTYVFSTIIGGRGERRHWLVTTAIMVSLIFSHLPTVVYLLAVVTGYTISLFVIRRLGSRSEVRDAITDFLPRFLVVFLAWLVYVGQDLIYVMQEIVSDLFMLSPFPSAALEFPLTTLLQIELFREGRLLVSTLAAAAVLLVGLVGRWKTRGFLMFQLSVMVAIVMGGVVGLGFRFSEIFRYLTYASLVAPYFLCLLFSRRHKARLHMLRIKFKAIMLATLVMSMVAAYPITPLYPKSGGQPILDDNGVNSIYALSGLQYFSSVYSSGRVLTTDAIHWQLMSFHPELVRFGWNTIFYGLDTVKSLAEVRARATLVLFHMGGKSGTSTLAMRALAPDLRNALGIVYTNGFFYVALAT